MLLSVESNRISMSSGLFDFVSFMCYYVKCLMIGLYIADIRNRARNGEVEIYKVKVVISIAFVVHIISQFCLNYNIENTVFLMSIMPVVYQSIRSFIKATKNFSLGFTFIYTLSHISYLVFLMTLKAPHSLVPSNDLAVNQYMLLTALLYMVVLAQILYHPKLWQKNKFLMAQLIYRPLKKAVSELPPKEEGEKYSCIICMEDFENPEDQGLYTHC